MIVYFADRKLNVLGHASTVLMKGVQLQDDVKTEDVETGLTTFSCKVVFDKANRKEIEAWTDAGNYVFRNSGDGDNECYVITEQELSTGDSSVYLYAEDAGLDLINEIALKYPTPALGDDNDPHPISYYVNKWTSGSGFEIGVNEIPDTETKYAEYEEQTVTERLHALAEEFECEIYFGFKIDRFEIVHKYVNIYKKRGGDYGVQLRLGIEVNSITVKKNINNLATALLVYHDGPGDNLDGETYDDGEYYIDGPFLISRTARAKWGRYYANGQITYENDIQRPFHVDTGNIATMIELGIEELKKVSEAEVNYEADIAKFPDGTRLGDTVYIVDDAGELYLSARILKIETSECTGSITATLGDYLIKTSGISDKVNELAAQFANLSTSRALTIGITSSQGAVFIDTTVATTLTAHVYMDGTELSPSMISALGTIYWYDYDELTDPNIETPTPLGTGLTLEIEEGSDIDAINVTARLEAD